MTIINAKWTLDEYHRMIDAGILTERHVELLKGEIVEMSPERPIHAHASDEADEYLKFALSDRAKVRVGKPITLPNNSEPEPDLAIVRRSDIYRDRHPYPEDIFWLIEYANTSLVKDSQVKTKVYAAAGIPEYWLVNLNKSSLTVYREPLGDRYSVELEIIQPIISPLAFPDLQLDVSRIVG